jgi:hypothetical protein
MAKIKKFYGGRPDQFTLVDAPEPEPEPPKKEVKPVRSEKKRKEEKKRKYKMYEFDPLKEDQRA